MLISLPWAARLVLALGAEAKLDLVPGAAEFALPFSTLEDAVVRVSFNYMLCHIYVYVYLLQQ